MSKRILFVSYTSDWTGPTNSLLLLLKHLRNRYEVAVLLPGHGAFSKALASEQIPSFIFRSLTKWSIPAIVRLIHRERFDIVYGNNASGSSRNALFAAKLAGVPFMCHVRGIGWNWSWRHRWFLRFADAVVAVSNSSATSVSRFVARDRLRVVYNGVELPSRCTTRERPQPKAENYCEGKGKRATIVSVSHICLRKGQKYAVEAMVEIVKRAPDTCLILVGSLERDPAYVNEIRKITRENALEDHVTILGFRKDVFRLLERADIFLHTAIEDPHPRSVVEAMGVGLPVVAFSVDGVAETVVHDETGYLLPVGDVSGMAEAVLKLVSDRSRWSMFSHNSRCRIEESFTAAATAQQVGDIISNVLVNKAK